MAPDPLEDGRFTACLDLLRRMGARQVQVRYDDDPEPTIWAVDVLIAGPEAREAAGALQPYLAAYRLCELLADGGTCASCYRPTAVSDDWTGTFPGEAAICWYVFDPETKKYRRGCEGDVPYGTATWASFKDIGRNDPCPCGSGRKFKRCHGSPTKEGHMAEEEKDTQDEGRDAAASAEATAPEGGTAHAEATAPEGDGDGATYEPEGEDEPAEG